MLENSLDVGAWCLGFGPPPITPIRRTISATARRSDGGNRRKLAINLTSDGSSAGSSSGNLPLAAVPAPVPMTRFNRPSVEERGRVLRLQIWLTAPGVISRARAARACDHPEALSRRMNSAEFLRG